MTNLKEVKRNRAIHPVLLRIKEILLRRDIEYAELQACLLSVLWGVWLLFLNPFDDPRGQHLYGIMMSYAADEIWGTLFLVLGVLQLYALASNKPNERAIFMLFSFAWWSAIFLTQVVAVPSSMTVPTTFLFSLSSAWGFVRIAAALPEQKETGEQDGSHETLKMLPR